MTGGGDIWTLTVYRDDGTPEAQTFDTEEEARAAARQLELDGWAHGIPDNLTAPGGQTVWHRAHDAAG
jgi:hypothetical protein